MTRILLASRLLISQSPSSIGRLSRIHMAASRRLGAVIRRDCKVHIMKNEGGTRDATLCLNTAEKFLWLLPLRHIPSMFPTECICLQTKSCANQHAERMSHNFNRMCLGSAQLALMVREVMWTLQVASDGIMWPGCSLYCCNHMKYLSMRMMLFINDLRATNLPDSQSKCRCQCLQSPDFQRRLY